MPEDEKRLIKATGAPSRPLYIVFAVSAALGIAGWLFLIALNVWWLIQPANLPVIKEPIPILNQNNEAAIGDTLSMVFDVEKTQALTTVSSARYLECRSGNLVTLTSAPITLPVGSYLIPSNDVIVPNKVSPGDTCLFVIEASFYINPLRNESVRFVSEPFTILPMKE